MEEGSEGWGGVGGGRWESKVRRKMVWKNVSLFWCVGCGGVLLGDGRKRIGGGGRRGEGVGGVVGGGEEGEEGEGGGGIGEGIGWMWWRGWGRK